MDIKITQQPAILGLNIKSPETSIQKKDAVAKHNPASSKVQIQRNKGTVKVNNDAARQGIGIYDSGPFMKRMADKGQQIAFEGIARRVSEGHQMSDIHKNGFILPKIMANAAWDGTKSVGIKLKPSADVQGQPGSTKIDFKIQPFKMDASSSEFKVDLNWGKVGKYLEQKNYIDIEWTGSLIDLVR
ncbi:MAG: hypothetical protein KAX49_00425 [Halanaerobiales bacterium]|nr:hypothetical protein [Halanaerobiales bacterium]